MGRMGKNKIIFRLREARKLKGMSLREAANGLDMSHEALRKYEHGDIGIDSEKLGKFAKFYGVTQEFLVPHKNRPKVEFGEIYVSKIRNI